MNPVGITIFVVTYALISARRLSFLGLNRPMAAVLGAVACVATGVLSPARALAAIDGWTLLLLLGVMGMGAFLVLDGFIDTAEARLERLAGSPERLLGAIVWTSGVLAAFVTNDAVCLLGAPLVVRLIQRHDLPAVPFLLALATGANTGSVATLVGNPQNMLCGVLGDLTYLDYIVRMAPLAAVALGINHLVLWIAYRKSLKAPVTVPAVIPPLTLSNANKLTLSVIALTAVLYGAGAPLAYTALGGFVVLQLLHRRNVGRVVRAVDWSLLWFFAGLFVVVEGLHASGATAAVFQHWPLADAAARGDLAVGALFLLGSNVVSNVPFILIVRDQMATLGDPTHAWTLLAVASTFAGNLTLLGSAANVIVAEAGREVGSFGFWEHLKVGAPIAVLTTLAGVGWLAVVG